MPELASKRTREYKLRRALRAIRHALDVLRRAVEEGWVIQSTDKSGYPASLQALVDGMLDAGSPDCKAMIYFIRCIPRDLLCADPLLSKDETSGKRNYQSSAAEPREGAQVFDVCSRALDLGQNCIAYRKWPPARGHAGFTLVELLGVMAIVAPLLTVAVPRYVNNVEKSREAVSSANLALTHQMLNRYFEDNGKYPDGFDTLLRNRYLLRVPPDSSQYGFTYIGLMAAVIIIRLVQVTLAKAWHTNAQREKEQELLFAGNQMRAALNVYNTRSPAESLHQPARSKICCGMRARQPTLPAQYLSRSGQR